MLLETKKTVLNCYLIPHPMHGGGCWTNSSQIKKSEMSEIGLCRRLQRIESRE